MISKISKMLVMMALPIMLLACGGPSGTGGTKASGMRFVVAPGQTLPAGVTAEEGRLGFGEVNFAGVEKGPIKYNLTNVTGDSVTFLTTGLVGGSGDIFITASSCFETLAADDSCEVTVTLSPKEKDRSYKDEYSVEFYFGTDQTIISEPVMLELSARTFAGDVEGVDGVTGLNVSQNYQSVEFDNVSLGNTSSPQVVQYFYFGDDEIIITPTESVTASATTATTDTDREISVESACGLLRYGDSCSVQLFYKPAVPSAELGDDKYSHLPVSVIQTGDPVVTSTIKMVKESFKPADSLLIEFQDNVTSEKLPKLIIADKPAPGAISKAENLKLVRTADSTNITQVFYRLESTNPAIQVTRNKCDLVLETGKTDSCELNISFSSEDAGAKVGYVIAVAGQERIFLKVEAEATTATLEPIGSDTATVLDTKTVELQADTSALSTTKRIKISHTGNTDGKPFSISLGGTDVTLFQYTTTCVDNKALTKENPVCYVDINFRGDTAVGTNKEATLTFKNDAGNTVMNLIGKTVTSVATSAATPVPGLTINTKSFAYPTTGIGLVSPTFVINLTNTAGTAISGLGTTSTDLATFTLNNNHADTACKSTLGTGDGNTCTLGYMFRPRNSLEKTGYISIFDNRTDANLRNNEIIQVVGRGALFNEYLSFGVVAPNETKTLLAAYTNDGTSGVKIDKVDVVEYSTKWKTAGFDDNKSKAKGNRVALIDNFFNQDNFTTATGVAPYNFQVLSSECNGITLDPGASCMIRLGFNAPTDVVDTANAENNHYRAYVNVTTSNEVIDRLHVISSTQDNSTMYMFPHQDINEKLDSTSTAKFELNDNISTVTTDKQFVVIGNDIYSYLGTDFRDSTGYKLSSDNKLRKYDASRNKWVILKPAGENPFVYTVGDTSAEPRLYLYGAQGKMVAHDGKLYVYGMSLSGTGSSQRRFDVYAYDPNFGTDGKWTNLGGSGGLHGSSQLSLTAYKGKLYFFGGRGNKNSKVTIYDIASNKWSTHGDQAVGQVPELRVGAATIVVEINKLIGTDNVSVPYLIMHGGSGTLDVNKTPINAIMYDVVLNDLWAMSLPYSVKKADGSVEEVTTGAYEWTNLQKKSPSDPSADGANTQRPADRLFHSFEYYDGKLLVTPGFDGDDYNEDHKGGTHYGTKENYFVLDPTELFRADGTLCNANSDVFCDAFHPFPGLKTEFLNMHLPATVSGDLWFHNWNILGVYFNKALEGVATK